MTADHFLTDRKDCPLTDREDYPNLISLVYERTFVNPWSIDPLNQKKVRERLRDTRGYIIVTRRPPEGDIMPFEERIGVWFCGMRVKKEFGKYLEKTRGTSKKEGRNLEYYDRQFLDIMGCLKKPRRLTIDFEAIDEGDGE